MAVVGLALPYRAPAYTLVYLLDDDAGKLHLVDPGFDTDDNWTRLVAAVHALGHHVDDIATATVTHFHPDHLGMARRVQAESGAKLIMHAAEMASMRLLTEGIRARDVDRLLDRYQVPADRRPELVAASGAAPSHVSDVAIDAAVEDGDRLPVPGRTLEVVHTPGHTLGSISIRDHSNRLLLTGDQILPTIHSGLGLDLDAQTGPNPIGAYLASLDRVAAWDDHEVLPAHEYRFRGLRARTEELAAHHRRRTAEVARELTREPDASVWTIASALTWSSGWEALRGPYLRSALDQTAWHRELVSI